MRRGLTTVAAMRDEIEKFLFREARLLDERRFEEWMNHAYPLVTYTH